jgi:hypothetical protein
VTVPEDGDARNAASVVVGFQALANRFKYLKLKLLDALIAGGTWLLGGTVTADLSSGGLNFQGNDDFGINLNSGVQLFANGRMGAHMFTAGRTGRANSKCKALTPAVNISLEPQLYDVYRLVPSADMTAQIVTATYVNGDRVRVINASTTFDVDIKDPSGTIIATLVGTSTNKGVEYTYFTDTSAWQLTDTFGLS